MEALNFVTLLGGVAAAWPTVVRAQQGERMLRIGLLMPRAADDPVGRDSGRRRSCKGCRIAAAPDRRPQREHLNIPAGGRSRPLSRLCG